MNDLQFDMTKCIICEAPAFRREAPFCQEHEFSPFYQHIQAILNFSSWRGDDMDRLDETIEAMQRCLDDLKERREVLKKQPDSTDKELMAVVYMAREVHRTFPKLAYYGGSNPFRPLKVVDPLPSQG